MGAPTMNRKRGEDYCSPNCKTPAGSTSNFNPVSKKPRFLPSKAQVSDQFSSSTSVVSKVCRYPDPTPSFRREVHAPNRPHKFRFPRSSGSSFTGKESVDMLKFLSSRYEKAKSAALGLFTGKKYKVSDKANEVIDVDLKTAIEADEAVSSDASMEEVELLENVNEGRMDASVLSEQRSKETNDIKENLQPSSSSVVSDMGDVNLKVDTAGQMLDKLSLKQGMSIVGNEPSYRKLLNDVKRTDDRLNFLRFQIEIQQKHCETIRLRQPSKEADEVEHVPNEPFVPLTEEEETEVARSLSTPRRMVLVTHENSNIEITGEILQCLRPGAWLNDEVINLYLELLKEREKRDPKKHLKCHFFSTFFYKKLIGSGGYSYKAVRRWTSKSKLGYCLLECEKIFIPIHKEIHWCLAVINKKDKKFQYLDSLGGKDTQVMKVLGKYIVDEVKDKNGIEIDISSWEKEFVKDLPKQENGFDCGMFMIKYADFYSRDIGLCFNQAHMPYFRLRTAKEILRLKAE